MQTPTHMCRHTHQSGRPPRPRPLAFGRFSIFGKRPSHEPGPLRPTPPVPAPPSLFNLSQKNLRGLIPLSRQSALLAWQPNPYTRSASSFKVDISTAEQFRQSDMKYRPQRAAHNEREKSRNWSGAAAHLGPFGGLWWETLEGAEIELHNTRKCTLTHTYAQPLTPTWKSLWYAKKIIYCSRAGPKWLD